ncbi:Glutamate synthase [NADH], amyloplastic [Geodia barretti]|uniref:glutamate synthase (ferredoxin) n=1 Tax=Geodia barretti TaxID=519541 RepID=A0AA35VYI3_GEOBA|nr:Glutamate synthase [NADH], amyloplastic [Geodia barretti]
MRRRAAERDAEFRRLEQEGLYLKSHEHDACGVGVVANIDGQGSHDIIQHGLEVLRNLGHRGACGCDPETGDGAGILVQMPHQFMDKVAAEAGIQLPKSPNYAVAMCFLPQDEELREFCKTALENSAREHDAQPLGWRDVPVDPDAVGVWARARMPHIAQLFLKAPEGIGENLLERRLYVIRKSTEKVIRSRIDEIEARSSGNLDDKDAAVVNALLNEWYIPSLSARTIVYKGMLMSEQTDKFYIDLTDPDFQSHFAMVHSRFSTNTLGSWKLAHPYRMLAHNGEINTVRGNRNWMSARELTLESDLFGDYISDILPICETDEPSDTASLDNAFEAVYMGGRSVAHTAAMMMPAAWYGHESMPQNVKDFYEYHGGIMEPWDGPAMIVFTDGHMLGAVLDRNGLRPFRYSVTTDNVLVMASETGVLDIPADQIRYRSRLRPGRMFLVDFEEKRIIEPEEVADKLASSQPYGDWLSNQRLTLDDLDPPQNVPQVDLETISMRQMVFGYTQEDMRMLIGPMGVNAHQPQGSMGNDAPLAVLSDKPQNLFAYFKQDFAQVSNPPLDAIREQLVTQMAVPVGRRPNLFDETEDHARLLRIDHPILRNAELAQTKQSSKFGIRTITISTLFPVADGVDGLKTALERIRREASEAIENGYTVLVLSDRGIDAENSFIPSLLATAAVHHHLIREKTCTQADILVESGEPREVHHFALLFGYGASGINPYLALESLADIRESVASDGTMPLQNVAEENYRQASEEGVLKTMSKMGISTLQGYLGAQIFEALGLSQDLIDEYFTWTNSRIGGIGLEEIAADAIANHARAYPQYEIPSNLRLDLGGFYMWRATGERHMWNPRTISLIQTASTLNSTTIFKQFEEAADEEPEGFIALRQMLDFDKSNFHPISLDEVEPIEKILPRFATGAISLGSISREAHETLAIAMNRIGARSNTGEGGEDDERYVPFDEVDSHIAQLIHDLKNVNPEARVHVKLVARSGVGIIAAGISKGKGDVVLISGDTGGTGASPLSSIKHAGIPWELGVSETQQVLVANGLRDRIVVQTDGQIKTSRDVAVAALLGADEWGVATAALITLGCIMLRKCHMNTCSVGVATQDPELRAKFAGTPEAVVNYFTMLAEELRNRMAQMGFRTVNDMIGRADMLKQRDDIDHFKAKTLDLSRILVDSHPLEGDHAYQCTGQDHALEFALDHKLIELTEQTIADGGLPDGSININFKGSTGQSFGAWVVKGVTFKVYGDANDYFGKGLSGGRLVIVPPEDATFVAEENIIIGNVALYGSTGGEAYIRGIAGERFCVRNSAANAVVEGIGDHGCEYMTGGRVVILGPTGRNFGAGMSGGVAYIWDPENTLHERFNDGMADLQQLVPGSDDEAELKTLIENHLEWTGSAVADRVLDDWANTVHQFKKIMPRDYARILREQQEADNQLIDDATNFSLNGGTVATPELVGRAV